MPDTMMSPDAPAKPLANRSAEIDKLAAALAKAQGEIEGAVKDKSNPAFRSKYADLGAVWDAIREPFSKNGLSVVQFPRRDGNCVEVETILMHSSGQWLSGAFSVPTAKQDAHGFGSATTYARRFSLSAVCGVAPVDDDGNAAAGRESGVLGAATNSIDSARAEIERTTGNGKSTYAVNKSAAAKKWADTAIEALNFAQTRDELDSWKKDNETALGKLSDNHPGEYDRVATAMDNAYLAVKARAA